MKSHFLYSLPKPIVFAHRGASRFAPENTLPAFQKALELGAKAIELDITLSKDDEVVVVHDDKVDRTSNGEGKVSGLTLSQLLELDFGSWFGNAFQNTKIPTLEQVLSVFTQNMLINIEIKNARKKNALLVQKTADLIKHLRCESRVIFSSFIARNIRQIRKELPECPAGFLTLPGMIGNLEIAFTGSLSPEMIHPHHSSLSKVFIQKQHSINRRVHSYTVNDPQLMRTLNEWGIDGFFCDDIPLAQQTLDKTTT